MVIDSSQLASDFKLDHQGGFNVLEGMSGLGFPYENHLVLLNDFNSKTQNAINHGNCFLVAPETYSKIKKKSIDLKAKTFLISQQIRMDFIKLLGFFNPYKNFRELINLPCSFILKDKIKLTEELEKINSLQIGDNISIAPSCIVGEEVKIGSNVQLKGNNFIGHRVVIGDNVVIHPNSVILDGSVIGNNTIIYAGAVIGSDGFGFETTAQGSVKIPQIGNVIIGENVEIGANTTIDRATINHTQIGNRVKIDNLVQIAHNVIIGDDCIIVSQVGIAGSVTIGKQCVFGGQVGLADHITMGDRVRVTAKSGVLPNKFIPDGTILAGIPATTFKEHYQMIVKFRKMFKKKPENN